MNKLKALIKHIDFLYEQEATNMWFKMFVISVITIWKTNKVETVLWIVSTTFVFWLISGLKRTKKISNLGKQMSQLILYLGSYVVCLFLVVFEVSSKLPSDILFISAEKVCAITNVTCLLLASSGFIFLWSLILIEVLLGSAIEFKGKKRKKSYEQ